MHRMFVAAVPASSDGEALGREALCSTKGLPALARRTYPFLPMRYGSAVLAAFVSISYSHVFRSTAPQTHSPNGYRPGW